MKGITYYALKNSKLVMFIMVALIILGMFSYINMPRQESPDVSAPAARVIAVYPGASPEKVESQVTIKIEDAVKELTEIDNFESFSKDGLSVTVLLLKDGADLEAAWDELAKEIDNIRSELPDEVISVDINTRLSESASMILSFSGEGYTSEDLVDVAETFEKELGKIDGVRRFDIDGKVEKEVVVTVDMEQLNQYGLTLNDIGRLVESQNIEIPTGNLEQESFNIPVRAEGTYDSVESIGNTILIVSQESGAVLKLRDIAEITLQGKKNNPIYKLNGEGTVLLTGYFEETLNVVNVGNEVKDAIEDLKQFVPSDIQIDYVTFQPDDVDQSIVNFIINLLQAILFVIIVIFIGMGMRNAAVVATTIPISICITLAVMNVLGIKLEQMSISALIIALGMLVDNAIVVSDSIQHKFNEGVEKFQASVEGTKEVAMSILTSTLTTVLAFMPLLLINSAVGEYVFGVPAVVIIALAASYLCALTTTPLMAYFFFKPSNKNGEVKEKQNRLRKLFDKLLDASLKHKRTMLGMIVIAIALTGVFALQMDVTMFPKADKDFVYIDIKSEVSSDITQTENLSNQVVDVLAEQEEISKYVEVIGKGLPKFYISIMPTAKSSDVGQILVKIDLSKTGDFRTRTEFVDYLQEEINKIIIGGTATINMLDVGTGGGYPIEFRVLTDSMEYLETVSEEVVNILEEIEGTVNVGTDFTPKEYQYYVDVDETKASSYGISRFEVQRTVSNALIGQAASTYRDNGNEYNIVVKGNTDTKTSLENMGVKSAYTGQKVLLKDVADVKVQADYPKIGRFNQKRSANIYADVQTGYNASDVESELIKRIDELGLENIELNFDGEATLIEESFSKLGLLGAFSLLLILAVLIFQFNSYTQPLIILLTVPLSFIGGILSLFITGQELSFTALLGLVSLMGIVVNNAIVLIDYINSSRNAGQSILEACRTAVNRRFRPIMLSTITTVIGLVPLVINGGETFRPMAIALMGGLLVSTVLTLVVIPTVYDMLIKEK